jgi:phage/plasmid-like protein (TIGR03299 family)
MPAYYDAGFSVREAMWHGLGEVLADYPGRDEAFRIAGHDWTVDRRRVGMLPEGTTVGHLSDGSEVAEGPVQVVTGWDALVRSDNGAVLSVAGPRYEVVQNRVMWDVLDALVDDPRVHYETAGTLRGGRIVWAMAKVDGEYRVGGTDSPLVPYLTVVNAHDGSAALRVMRNAVRVVCQNTVNLAIGEATRAGRLYTFRHTANVMERIEQARAAVDGIGAAAAAFVELGNELLTLKVGDDGRRLFLERFIPAPNAALVTDRAMRNIDEARQAVDDIVRGSTGTVTAEQGETAYGLFTAGVEYLDHVRKANTRESRFGRALIEPGDEKRHLVKLAREAATV